MGPSDSPPGVPSSSLESPESTHPPPPPHGAPPVGPGWPPPPVTEKRYLKRNLPSALLFRKIREAERRKEAGERELGFYLLDLRSRKVYQQAACVTFKEFIRRRTGLNPRKAAELVSVAERLESLPAMDAAFARGEIYWSAVRAMASVAKPETEEEWIEFARSHRVDEVERKVASSRHGDGPRGGRYGGKPTRYPYRLSVTAEKHQAFECLCAILSKKRNEEVTIEEALFEAATEKIAREIAEDGAGGRERILPSSFRLVIHRCQDCSENAAATSDGPEWIDQEVARKLLQGAEVLDLSGEDVSLNRAIVEAALATQPASARANGASPTNSAALRSKKAPPSAAANSPARGNGLTEVFENPHHFCNKLDAALELVEKVKPAAARANGAVPMNDAAPTSGAAPTGEAAPSSAAANSPARGNELTEVLENPHHFCNKPDAALEPVERVEAAAPRADLGEVSGAQNGSQPLVKHHPDLSLHGMPMVPPEERDIPTPPDLLKKVLSRDGYFCLVPGCTNLAETGHHLQWRSLGGRTELGRLGGFCKAHHDLIHDGILLASGNAETLKLSDQNFRPLFFEPRWEAPSVEFEVEGKPPESASTSLSPPSGTAPPEPRAIQVPPVLSEELDRAFWLAHRHLFEWSERRKVLIYHPEWAEDAPSEPLKIEKTGRSPQQTALSALRGGPRSLEEFQGQRRTVQNLSIALRAAKLRGELPPPVLLSGPPGLGKTTLARLIAVELRSKLHQAQGPALLDLGALVTILPEIEKGDALFIDEIHGAPHGVLECLYQALDEGALSLPVIQGENGARGRLVKLHIEPFLLIGATTEESLLPRPLRSRFTLKERLDLYSREDLERLAISSARDFGIEVSHEGAEALARGSRGTPRILLANLGRSRDLAQVECEGSAITGKIALRALEFQGIDRWGLSEAERKLLGVLASRNRPLGLRTLSDLLGESPRTLLEVLEPYLVHEGFIARTFRGRVATAKGQRALEAGLRSLSA